MGAVLATAVTVEDSCATVIAVRWPSSAHCDHKIPPHAIAFGPCCYPEGFCKQSTQNNHAPRRQVQDHNQIQPPVAGPDLADVTRPFPVRPSRRGVAIQQVQCDIKPMIAVGCGREFGCSFNDNPVLAHKLSDTPAPADCRQNAAGQTQAKRRHRELQRAISKRIPERGAVLDTDRRSHPDRHPEEGLLQPQTQCRPRDYPAGRICHEDETGKAGRIDPEINPRTLYNPGETTGIRPVLTAQRNLSAELGRSDIGHSIIISLRRKGQWLFVFDVNFFSGQVTFIQKTKAHVFTTRTH